MAALEQVFIRVLNFDCNLDLNLRTEGISS